LLRNPLLGIAKPLPARLRKTQTSKLKMKRQNENIELKGTARKDFVFADPFLPFGTIGEANAQTTHLVTPTHKQALLLPKELFSPLVQLY